VIIGKLYQAMEVKALSVYRDAKNDQFAEKFDGYLIVNEVFVLLDVIDVNLESRPLIKHRALVLTKTGKALWINVREGEEIGFLHESISEH
jgi:hypothetical protein